MKGHIELLQEKFDQRRVRNQRYSLRSYSQLLGLDPGSLSSILRGRRPLSPLRARQIVDRLKLSRSEKRDFYLSLLSRHRLPASIQKKLVADSKSRELDNARYFQIIAEWEFAAALCLMDIKTFVLTPESLQSDLGISKARALSVIGTLAASGLIELSASGSYTKQAVRFSTSEDVRSMALEQSHGNELRRAQQKLRDLDTIERDFSSITIAARSRQLGQMKAMIREFRRDFETRFESTAGDCVFQLNLQLYPATKKRGKKVGR